MLIVSWSGGVATHRYFLGSEASPAGGQSEARTKETKNRIDGTILDETAVLDADRTDTAEGANHQICGARDIGDSNDNSQVTRVEQTGKRVEKRFDEAYERAINVGLGVQGSELLRGPGRFDRASKLVEIFNGRSGSGGTGSSVGFTEAVAENGVRDRRYKRSFEPQSNAIVANFELPQEYRADQVIVNWQEESSGRVIKREIVNVRGLGERSPTTQEYVWVSPSNDWRKGDYRVQIISADETVRLLAEGMYYVR